MTDAGRPSAKRTGDRDDRAPLEKLITLFEDIFEAEDSLPADVDQESLPADFFSPLTTEPSRPQLHPNVVRKLSKLISQVSRPMKRLRSSTSTTLTPHTSGPRRFADVETTILSRILKILERSVRAGEDLDPFKADKPSEMRQSTSPNKKTKVSKKSASGLRSPSQTPAGGDELQADASAGAAGPLSVTDSDLDTLAHTLELARESILAADCCIAMLGADRLPKQVYSEELITACLGAIKNRLERIVYPFVESSDNSALLVHVYRHEKAHRSQIAEVFQVLASVLPRINNLVCADTVAMSDSIIIQGVYIAIGPFFITEAGTSDSKGKKESVVVNTLGQTAMRGLRLEALSLIRSIFANHEDQRPWIIEEILSSLIKLSDTKQKAGQFRLRDGRSIRTVSALLLQLVQTSAHGVRIQARRLARARQQALAMRRQESMAETPSEKSPGPFLDEKDNEEIQLYMSGLESATKAAKAIVLFLTQRSGRAKATKNSNEAEYRAIFDNLVSDLLVVLFWPEWPAASLLLSIICKYMVSSLDDVKSSSQTENNAAKTMALDHLGVIAAAYQCADCDGFVGLKALDEVLSRGSAQHFERLAAAHQDLATHLAKRSAQDQAYESARELTAVTWGQEVAIALKQCNTSLRLRDDDFEDARPSLPFGHKVKSALRDVWKETATDVFNIGSPEEVARIDRLAEEIGIVQDLRNSYQPILNVTLLALDAPPVFVRTKALRALGQIVTSDPTILIAANVRRGIESHLLDSSPAVRDAAVELIGKYVIESPEVAGDYYQKIADRIADTGLGVRKRVIKLLRAFYGVTDDIKRRTDICTRLVLRMFDEDDTVKDLSIKTLEELWFLNPTSQPALQKLRNSVHGPDQHDKTQLLNKVSVIMGVAASFRDRQSPLEDVLHKIMASKEDADTSQLHARYREICEALIDGLVDASDLPGFTVINCIRTIYLLSSAYPAILSGSNASTLLPYLKNAMSTEEQVTSDYMLKIFRVSIPHMPKTAIKFGNELQMALQPMVLKPSTAGGVQALQETVACLCAVVQHLTHDFTRLVGLLKSCNARLQSAAQKKQLSPPDLRTLSILIFIISLLVEHCDFDHLRTEQGSIIEHVYNSLLRLYQKHSEPGLRGRTLQCLGMDRQLCSFLFYLKGKSGFLFRAQPTLMTLESSAMIMDATFASREEEGRARLLKIMQEFLVSEAAKHAQKEKSKTNAKSKQAPTEVNMEELVGNTDGFADSGVSSAIVQRYMDPILDAALSQHQQTQGAAVDILSFTIKQGLAHPLQSFPVIIALETSPNMALSARASSLHSVLHSKHASLLNSRYIVSARASFSYQAKLLQGCGGSGSVEGVRGGTALLHRWFALVREKRGPKLEFLRALVRAFDVGTSLATAQEDVDFARYMAENFAAFDYKTQEEVLLVVKNLTNVLSTAGMQCVEALSPGHLLAQLQAPTALPPLPPPTQVDSTGACLPDVTVTVNPSEPHPTGQLPAWQTLDKLPLLRTSVLIALVMLLKTHLKNLYGLTEEKCLKWVIGKKNALGDKPATRRTGVAAAPLTWGRLPFATRPLLTMADMGAQRDRFLEIWNEDGVTGEPEDDFA
ncbi:sister chromatid cohesion C-terminus-domain-containing protein [Russula brevipes]|nr:sister chromatid cohesion C-terminus-domain-containing protein [Russula brevipes]